MTGSMTNIGQELRALLMADETIASLVKGRIYPYTTQTEVNEPHIVYDGIVADYEYTKDGQYPGQVSLTIHCNASDYEHGRQMAQAVEGALINHSDVRISTMSVDYDAAALMFTFDFNLLIDYE